MKHLFARLFTTLALPAAIYAQKEIRSEDLAVGFIAPDDFEVLEDDVERLIAFNKNLSVQILNGENRALALEDLPDFLLKWSTDSGYVIDKHSETLTLNEISGDNTSAEETIRETPCSLYCWKKKAKWKHG